ncbi:MAG: peptidylprolyl isomerase, partial [Rikenellaceae bacterium]
MKVKENQFVSLSYTLTVDGNVVEKVTADKPLDFIFGTGGLLPKFEENVAGLEKGGKFAFTLTPEESYGEYINDAIVPLPKDIFKVDGEINEEMLAVGNMLPMMDNDGNRLMGFVKSVEGETVTMDFNHPMAGKILNFEGEVVGVREATDAEKASMLASEAGEGCGCG